MERDSPVKEDGLDQRDHVSAGVVTGTNAGYMDQLQGRGQRVRAQRFTQRQPGVRSL